MATTKALGRGLKALFNDIDGGTRSGDVRLVAVASLEVNPHQPRQFFDKESLKQLAASIKAQGILQPLLVRHGSAQGSYQIVAGERRWRAAKLAGIEQVPVLVKNIDDAAARMFALVENLQREDLDPMEQAQALGDLLNATQMTQEALGEKLGMSRSAVANSLRLLTLPRQAQDALRKGVITPGHARCLLAIEDESMRQELLEAVTGQALTVRQAEDAVTFWKHHRAFPWQSEDGPEKPSPPPAAQRSRKKPPALASLQKELGTMLGCKALVSGTEDAGKITLSYTTRDELAQILHRMGISNA